MIPKIIHYCWFGGNPLPDEVEKMIKTWKLHCPNYEIRQWDESNFDVNKNRYCKEAYYAKKWAFVSDYARLKVLYQYGGIYLDTDVELIKPLDRFLGLNAWVSFQSENQISTCVIAASKKNEWIKLILGKYEELHFYNEDGSLNMKTNVDLITEITKEHFGIVFNNHFQYFGDNNAIYPFEYFCAKDMITEKYCITDNTYAVHHFRGTWMDLKKRVKTKIRIVLSNIIGRSCVLLIKKIINS